MDVITEHRRTWVFQSGRGGCGVATFSSGAKQYSGHLCSVDTIRRSMLRLAGFTFDRPDLILSNVFPCQASCSSLPCSCSSCLSQWIREENVGDRRENKGRWGVGGRVDQIKSITVACRGEMVLSSLASQCATANLVQLSQSLLTPPTHSLSLCFLCLFPLLVHVLPNPWAVWLEYQWISLY